MKLNEYYKKLPAEVRDTGRMTYARTPPKQGYYLVSDIWDHFMPNWRKDETEVLREKIEAEKKFDEIRKFATTLTPKRDV